MRLRGHSDWVKNVNIIDRENMISGGFDSKIVHWDLTENVDEVGHRSLKHKQLFAGSNRDELNGEQDNKPFLLRTAYRIAFI